jgi:putative ABC transport system permease protein
MAVAILPSSMEVVWGTFRPVVLGPGFEADEYLTARVLVETETGAGGEIVGEALMARFGELHAELARQLENAPGIFSQVTAAAAVPGEDPLTVIETEEPDGPRRIRRYAFRRNSVDAAFFDVFEVDLLAGRRFAPGDFASGGSVIVVDRTFAAQAFGAENPVGRRIRSVAQAGAPAGGWQEIVGVVSDLPENTSRGAMYAPLSPGRIHPVSLAMRVGPGAAGAANRIREIAADLGPGLRVEEVRTVDEVYRWTQRLANIPVYILAGVTLSVLLLSGAGIYALTSFTVAQRRREIGIRSALGARSGRLLGGILARVLLQVGVGAFIGVLGALLLHHALNLETLGGWHLPGILPAAVTLMCVVGLLAASGPARRALRLEIFETLRDG